MPLFPMQRPIYAPAGAMQGKPPEQPRQRRRSLFGGPARGIIRREDGDPGTLVNHFLFGLNGVEQMRDGAMRRDMFGNQVRQQKLEERETEEQRAAREAAIGTLDPAMQPWARLAPGAAAESMFGRPAERYGDLESIDGRLGQRNTITGQYDWAPQVPASENRPPAGYEPDPGTGGLRAIQGGPADIRQTAEGRARAQQLDSSARQLDNAIAVLDEAAPQVSGQSSGLFGQALRGVGGSAAYNLNQVLEPVRAILSFESLAEMRRNSATGGALGSIAVRELELLGNTVRSLDTAQSPEQLRRAIAATRSQLQVTRDAIAAAQGEYGGEEAPAPAPTNNGSTSAPRRRVWNPATGRLE